MTTTTTDNILTIGGLALIGYVGFAVILPQLKLYPTAVVAGGGGGGGATTTITALTPAVLGLKATGQKVAMQKGANHRNGQRFNVNHKFKNYLMIGYFKTGSGQQVIELKTDGPNHGGCSKLPECVWIEPDLEMSGQSKLGAEFPHPTNHNNRPCPSCKSLGVSIAGKEIGFAVGAWNTGQYRTVAMWANPIASTTGWKKLLQETDKGQITTPQLAIRDPGGVLMSKYENGMEAEIRMHGAKGGDTSMRECNVWEIQPPAGTITTAYVEAYLGRGIADFLFEQKPKPYRRLNNTNFV